METAETQIIEQLPWISLKLLYQVVFLSIWCSLLSERLYLENNFIEPIILWNRMALTQVLTLRNQINFNLKVISRKI